MQAERRKCHFSHGSGEVSAGNVDFPLGCRRKVVALRAPNSLGSRLADGMRGPPRGGICSREKNQNP